MGFAEQARIQEQHRAAQTRLQAIVAADTARVFPLLDVNNLDKSFGGFVDGMRSVVNARRTVSASLGASCFTAIRKDAGIVDNFIPALASSVPSDKFFTSMLVTGPISMKKNMAAGMDPVAARDASLRSTIRANQRHVADGGRGTILNAVKSDRRALGWARLTDGRPCAFCALLASRGPAYKSEGTSSFRSHDGCGCTAVPVFDLAAPWPGRAQEFRDAYDANISGKFPGGDGNNKAVQAWRKHYDVSFDTGTTVAAKAAAETAALAVESSVEWTAAWQSAKAKLPENLSTIGRTGARDLLSAEAQELAAIRTKKSAFDDWIARFNSGADREVLRKEYTTLTGDVYEGNYWQSAIYRISREYKDLEKRETEFLNIQRGSIDIDGTTRLPGAVANEHLDAVLQAGSSVGRELDRRIALRLGDTTESAKALAEVTAKREAIEKKLEAELAKAKAYKEEVLRPKAIQRVDAGFTSVFTGTREEIIDKMLNAILYNDKVNQANVKKIKALMAEQGDTLAIEQKLAEGIKPGTPQYALIQREETIKILSEVREMGGAGATYVKKGVPIKKGELLAAMDKAHEAYPASWMARVREKYPQVDLGQSKRGYNSGGTEIRLSKHTVKQLPDDVGYDAVAIHELGHSMETAVDGLAEMEWAYHARRGAIAGPDGALIADKPKWLGGFYGRDEIGIADQWRELYTGKVYSSTPGSNMEVFTTGVESLLTGSKYLSNDALGYDVEFRDWLLGVLSVL